MSEITRRVAGFSPEKRALLLRHLHQKKANGHDTRPSPQKRDRQAFPLSFAQQRLWFLDQLEPRSITYLMPGAKHLRGPLNRQALKHSVRALIERHEILRTTFQVRDGQPMQIIAPRASEELPVIDLCRLGRQWREQEARRLTTQEAHQPCNLARGPLL